MSILPYFYSFFVFIGTLVYVRLFGATARRFMSAEKANQWSSLAANIVFCVPTVGFGAALLVLRSLAGWLLISPTAIWLSFAWDAYCLAATLLYANRLRVLRAEPSTAASVKLSPLDDMSHWPHARSFHFKAIGAWFLRRIFRQVGFDSALGRLLGNNLKNNVTISPGDLRTVFRNDLRYIDIVSDIANELEIDPDKAEEVPHILFVRTEIFQEAAIAFLSKFARDEPRIPKLPDESESATKDSAEAYSYDLSTFFQSLAGVTSRSYPLNRALNTALSEDLWDASCRTCTNTPQVIATTWKLFHFQDEVRLRLVTLFNTIDLLQRLMGSYVLCTMRDSGELNEVMKVAPAPCHLPPGTFGDWNKALGWALANSMDSELEPLRAILLEPREDFDELMTLLTPFWKILGDVPIVAREDGHTLAAWDILRIIRNKTIGHGTVGLNMKLRPRTYIGPLHQYLLAVIRDVSEFDLAVYGFESPDAEDLAAFSQGLTSKSRVTECDAWLRISDRSSLINVSPYLRFRGSRVLFPNRTTKTGFQYVDYKPQTIVEPSFITLPVDPDLFLKKSDGSAEGFSSSFNSFVM